MNEYINGVGRWKQRAMKSLPALKLMPFALLGNPSLRQIFGGLLMATGRLQLKISGRDIKNVLRESSQDHSVLKM